MTREEYANKTKGYTAVRFDKTITVLEDKATYSLKYKEIKNLLSYKNIMADMPQGFAKKRVKQLESLGYKIKEILWQGEAEHEPTKILFDLQ